MNKLPLSFVVLSILSGCALTNEKHYSEETTNAIRQSENKLNTKLTNLELAVSNQSDYIESLESEVIQLRAEISTENASSLPTSVSNKEKPENTSQEPNSGLNKQIVLGSVEKVQIESLAKVFNARVDTGAATSSINAVNIQKFEREGKKWVKFSLTNEDKAESKNVQIEAPVIRYANIRQASSETAEKRPVVELWVKLGKLHEKAQFTLADRSQMTHPVLLGREFLKDIALVDVSGDYLHSNAEKKK